MAAPARQHSQSGYHMTDGKPCARCGLHKPMCAYKTPSFTGPANCRDCARDKKRAEKKRYYDRYPDKHRVKSRQVVSKWGKANPHKVRAKRALRRLPSKEACPPWADRQAIEAVYAEAVRLSIETGTPHHVDHIVPLRSDEVCGLHVPWNLRPIPCAVNLSKGSKLIGVEGVSYWGEGA